MISKIGYRWVVRLRITSGHWYPDQGGTMEKAAIFHTKREFDMVCNNPGITAFHVMLETLLTQEYGKQGVHDRMGTTWTYEIDIIRCKGKVWLPLTNESEGSRV